MGLNEDLGLSQQDAQARLKMVFGTPKTTKKKTTYKDYISEAGGIAGGLVGSLAGPVGSVAGATLGAGLGQGLENKMTGKKDNVLKEAAISGAGELVGLGVGKLASKGLGKIGEALGKGGKEIALKGIRPSPSQQSKFAKLTGGKLEDFVTKNKLFGKGTQQVDELIAPLQQEYDDLAVKSGKMIKSSDIYGTFNKKIAQLKGVPNSNAQSLAAHLEQELDLLKGKYGNKPVNIGEITELRRTIDKLISPKAFVADPITAGKNKNVRDLLKDVIDTATGKETATIGTKLRDLRAFRDIADIQEGLGKGNLPMGLTQLLSMGGGATVGAGSGYAQGGNSASALKGALMGMGFTAAANNPKVLAFLSEQLIKKGSSLAGKEITKTGLNIAGTAGQMAANFPKFQTEQPAGTPTETPIDQPIPGQLSTEQPTTETGGISQDNINKAMMYDLQTTGGKNIDTIKQIVAMMGSDTAPKKQTAAQALVGGYANRIQSANQIFDQLAPEVNKKLTGKISIARGMPERFKSSIVKQQEQAESNFVHALLRRESGAVISPSEFEKAAKQYFPQPGDSAKVLEQKRFNRYQVQQNLANESQGETVYQPVALQ